MFVTLLKFSENRAAAAQHMAAHNAWLAKGFADGAFICAGSLRPSAGGAIIANGESRTSHDERIAADPFVIHGIVIPETIEIDPTRTIDALVFLKASS